MKSAWAWSPTILLSLLAISLPPVLRAQEDPAPGIAELQGTVHSQNARIRPKKTKYSPVLKTPAPGEKFELSEENDGWYRILAGPFKGNFIFGRHLRLTANNASSGSKAARLGSGIEANRQLVVSLSSGFLAREEYAAAQKVLQEHLARDRGHEEGWNLLGLVQMKLGDEKKAETAFFRAAELSSGDDKATFLYNAADLSNRRGDTSKTQEILKDAEAISVASGGLVGAHIASIRNVIRAGEPLPALRLFEPGDVRSSGFSALLSLKTGHNSNVLLLPDSAKSGPTPSSAFLSPTAQIGFSSNSFSLRSITAYTAHEAAPAKPYDSIFQSAAIDWSPTAASRSRLQLNLGNRFDLSFLNADSMQMFSWAGNGYAFLGFDLSQDSILSLDLSGGYQKFPGQALTVDADNRNGALLGQTLLYRTRVGNVSLTGGGSFQKVFAQGNNYRSQSYGLLAGIAGTLPWQIGARLGLGGSITRYPQSIANRRDEKIDASLRLTKVMPFNRDLSFSVEDIFGKNFSSVPTANYSQNTIYLQTNYAF